MYNKITFGIDKTSLGGFTINSINFKKLESMYKAKVSREPAKSLCVTENGEQFDHIKIKDELMFKTFQAGYRLDKNKPFPVSYVIMDLSIAFIRGNNVIPLSINELTNHIKQVLRYLNEVYGVNCLGSLENLKFRNIELNVNIPLKHKFRCYVRAFRNLMFVAPKTYTTKQLYEKRKDEEIKTLMVENNTVSVKFYDKREQVKKDYGFDIGNELLRVEYQLKTSQKIKDVFGSSSINHLTDSKIAAFISNQFYKDFECKYYHAINENQKKLKKLIKASKKDGRYWIQNLGERLWNAECQYTTPLLFDINDISELIKLEDKKNYSRNWNNILYDFPHVYQNQHEKYNEIFKDIGKIKG